MALKEDKNYYKTTEFVSEKIRSDRGWNEPKYDFSNRQTVTPLNMTEKEYQKQYLELMNKAMKTKDTSVTDEFLDKNHDYVHSFNDFILIYLFLNN